MREILNIMQAVAREFDDVGVLGTFIENQDQVRFAQLTQDKALTYNALAFQFLTDGIPIHYYGALWSQDSS
jgi:alpha-amylase